MPKLKTNKAAKKRFKVSKNGKVLRGRPGRRHLLSVKTGKRRRQLRRVADCSSYDNSRIRKLLGQG
jgi:large subunit ribosomal protein L35